MGSGVEILSFEAQGNIRTGASLFEAQGKLRMGIMAQKSRLLS